jgi:hypothetical protein
MKKRSKFINWAFDLLALLLIGVMLLSHYLNLSPAWEQTLAIIVIVVVYGLIAWWWANPPAMVEPDSTKAELATERGEDRHQLTKVQAHYHQVIGMKSKRKLPQCLRNLDLL